MPGTHKIPKMGHEPKMGHKPKMIIDTNKLTDKSKKGILEGIGKKAMMFKTPKQVEEVRPKMATPKVEDEKNFSNTAQQMAKMLVPKMDHAKMYKPTKYHDMPKMGHEPKMGHKPKMGHEPKMGHKPKAYHDKK